MESYSENKILILMMQYNSFGRELLKLPDHGLLKLFRIREFTKSRSKETAGACKISAGQGCFSTYPSHYI